ncbi:DivIVA domain-containing protein [Saccharomonospora saliphila]|uniref:DivIVA domain-containing protein n=1 Tax=Saccharomonospora saliphila TaxID=369829 RepID=UPI000366152E|nr:DivIVA domain-containing protein [Saccharomonospora saliphila]
MSFTADDLSQVEFGNAPLGRRGYSKTEVDAFVRRIERALAGRGGLTPADIDRVQFGRPLLGRRGYDEREVDEFLDDARERLARGGAFRAAPRTSDGGR